MRFGFHIIGKIQRLKNMLTLQIGKKVSYNGPFTVYITFEIKLKRKGKHNKIIVFLYGK